MTWNDSGEDKAIIIVCYYKFLYIVWFTTMCTY